MGHLDKEMNLNAISIEKISALSAPFLHDISRKGMGDLKQKCDFQIRDIRLHGTKDNSYCSIFVLGRS